MSRLISRTLVLKGQIMSVVPLRVSWANGDVILNLTVSPENWSKILRGERVVVKGKGYHYEGEFFQDEWYFSGGLDGDLRVTYDSLDGGTGDGFVGSPRDALEV
jgi:hypothetical protein